MEYKRHTNSLSHQISTPGDRSVKKSKPKPKSKKRTSIWLEDDLRARLDKRASDENRSLANVIDTTLREGLARKSTKKVPDATVFG